MKNCVKYKSGKIASKAFPSILFLPLFVSMINPFITENLINKERGYVTDLSDYNRSFCDYIIWEIGKQIRSM